MLQQAIDQMAATEGPAKALALILETVTDDDLYAMGERLRKSKNSHGRPVGMGRDLTVEILRALAKVLR